jgi:drug/metabolite transporter (DMT)-like permease
MTTSHQRGALGAALLSALLFGFSTPLSKLLLEDFSGSALAGLFYLGAALGLAPLVITRGELALPRDAKSRRYLAGAALFGGMLGPVLLLWGLALSRATSVSMLLNLETVATAVLGVLFFREHLGRWTWVANGGVALAGLLLSFEHGRPSLLGGALVAAAGISWALDNQFTSLIDGISPLASTFWKGLAAGSVNLTLAFTFGSPFGARPDVPWLPIGGALAIGALSFGASISLYISSAQRLGATRAQMVFASAPFFGVLGSLLFVGEHFSMVQAGAALLLTGSILLFFLDAHGHEHEHEELEHSHAHTHGGRGDDGHHDHEHDNLPAGTRHTHAHAHPPHRHTHAHWPDLHHRHEHGSHAES